MIAMPQIKEVTGSPQYLVDDSGRVFRRKGPRSKFFPMRELNPFRDAKGYLVVTLCTDGAQRDVKVHRLVANAFLPEPASTDLVIRHVNGDKGNNGSANLMWGTHQDNADDRVLHGWDNKGEKNGRVRLTKEDVISIRTSRANGETLQSLADRYGVASATVSYIVVRKTWAHVP